MRRKPFSLIPLVLLLTLVSNTAVVAGGILADSIIGDAIVDNFDDYIDTTGLLGTWADGSTNGTGSEIFEDLTGVMKLTYSNSSAPYRSEASRQFLPDPNDLSSNGMVILGISFLGAAGNNTAQMYVVLSDGTHTAEVTYNGSGGLTNQYWDSWYIKLQDFSDLGVDVTNIVSMTIGIGDGSPGGSGVLYIDDIVLYQPRCLPPFRLSEDLNGDCSVDVGDLGILVNDWLMSDYTVIAQQPAGGNLVVHYAFDETSGNTAYDTSGNGNNAAVEANDIATVWDTSGYNGRCIVIEPNTTVTVPNSVFSTIGQEVTVSLWVNGDTQDYPRWANQAGFAAGAVPREDNLWDHVNWSIDSAGSYGGQWNHYAFVRDDGLMRIYHNGLLVGQNTEASQQIDGSGAGLSYLASSTLGTGTQTQLRLDEFRIYDYALSQQQVLYLAVGVSGQLNQSLEPAILNFDFNDDGQIDLMDFSVLAGKWLLQPF